MFEVPLKLELCIVALMVFPLKLATMEFMYHCTMAQALNKFGIKDFAKMIPSAPILPLSLSNSLSFA